MIEPPCGSVSTNSEAVIESRHAEQLCGLAPRIGIAAARQEPAHGFGTMNRTAARVMIGRPPVTRQPRHPIKPATGLA